MACGAIVATDKVAPSLRPGMHASTFGGNPLACVAGVATVETIECEGLLDNCREMSALFLSRLKALQEEMPIIGEIRTQGLMIGVDLTISALPAVGKCMERGLLINATHDTVVRLLPALNISPEQVEEGCDILGEALREMSEEST